MSKLNLREASLLDASGELSYAARQSLLAKIARDPSAHDQYQETQENFTLLQSLPIPEPSAAERSLIPAMIKKALHRTLAQREKKAGHVKLLLRVASAGLALAACAVVTVSMMVLHHKQLARQNDQIARINILIDRVSQVSDEGTSAYDLALTNSAASSRQTQTEAPALADLQGNDRTHQLNALAAVPTDNEDSGDHSAPPGSF